MARRPPVGLSWSKWSESELRNFPRHLVTGGQVHQHPAHCASNTEIQNKKTPKQKYLNGDCWLQPSLQIVPVLLLEKKLFWMQTKGHLIIDQIALEHFVN